MPPLRTICLFVLGIGLSSSSRGETRRAVLVGINQYAPEGGSASAASAGGRSTWTNLEGAVADAESMRQILIARFHFRPADVLLLKDGEATREAILGAIQSRLI